MGRSSRVVFSAVWQWQPSSAWGAAKRMETNRLFILQFSPFFRNAQKGQARGLPFCGSEVLYAML